MRIHICATLIAKLPCKNIHQVDSSPLTQKLNRNHTSLFKEFEVRKEVRCGRKAPERHSAVQQLNPRTFAVLIRNLEQFFCSNRFYFVSCGQKRDLFLCIKCSAHVQPTWRRATWYHVSCAVSTTHRNKGVQ